jgi:hypothetical protein
VGVVYLVTSMLKFRIPLAKPVFDREMEEVEVNALRPPCLLLPKRNIVSKGVANLGR